MSIRSIISFCTFVFLFTTTQLSFADEIIVGYRHLADPVALVYNGPIYLYASNDDENDAEKNSGYKIKSIVCVSSSDMKDVAWESRTWAPAAQKNGLTGTITTLSGTELTGENSIVDPNKFAPKTTSVTFGSAKFEHQFPASSITAFQLKAK